METDSVLSVAVVTLSYIISNKRDLQRLYPCSGGTSPALHRDGPSSPGPVRAGCVVNTVALGQGFLLSVSFHQCCTVTLTFITTLKDGQNLSFQQKRCYFRNRGASRKKTASMWWSSTGELLAACQYEGLECLVSTCAVTRTNGLLYRRNGRT